MLPEHFPDEVALVFARTGTAEVATDPMGPNVQTPTSCFIPRSSGKSRDLRRNWQRKLKSPWNLPGQNFEFSQPIELRFNELIAGVRCRACGQSLWR